MEKIITEIQLNEIMEPFLGKSVTRSWKGHGSALFLEIGSLDKGKGELTIMIEWSWRVERNQSIWFGSWSEDDQIERLIPKLNGYQLKNISSFARLPEISVSLSENIWVNSFATSEENPEWALIFNGNEIISRSGKILLITKDNTEPINPGDLMLPVLLCCVFLNILLNFFKKYIFFGYYSYS